MKDFVIEQIKKVAANHKVQKVVLYGSRARGDHSSSSDYDVAVFGNKITPREIALFYADVEEINTLKKIDITFLDGTSQNDFIQTVKEEGVVIYEQTEGQTK